MVGWTNGRTDQKTPGFEHTQSYFSLHLKGKKGAKVKCENNLYKSFPAKKKLG